MMNNSDTNSIDADILFAKEEARVRKIISSLYMYDNDPEQLTKIYTSILSEENVGFILTRVSQDPIFLKHFPEFYAKNQFGENVINCQQNNAYHRYGVFKHILYTIEYVGSTDLPIGDWQRKILKWTMFLHDIGKPYVKIVNDDGSESFAGHDDKSVELAKDILPRFKVTEEEKEIILKLIKYHDRYLNEGEVIFDNLKFLASELKNNKELFFMLLDVKEADARAKCIDVYNKFKITKKKYVEFLNSYFSYNVGINNGQSAVKTTEEPIAQVTDSGEYVDVKLDSEGDGNIRSLKLKNMVDNAISKKGILVKYQPVIDLQTKLVCGYETFTGIEESNITIVEMLNYAKNLEQYDKLQQILFINAISSFNSMHAKESKLVFANVDLTSYNKYVNKPRIYDLMRNGQVTVSFHNYERQDITSIKDTINLIHQNRGYVALDDFGMGTLGVRDINSLDVDYLVPDMTFIRGIDKDEEKQKFISELVTFCIGKQTNIIAVGVETREELNTLQNLGVRYVQGNYIAAPDTMINMINSNLEGILTDTSNDMLV